MKLNHLSNKCVLYACLDWGNGHVTRSIGLIRRLLSQSNEVIVACTIQQQEVFQIYFEENIRYEYLAPTNWQFKGDGRFRLELLRNVTRLSKSIRANRNITSDLIKRYAVDVVLSDHHYGVYSSEIPSVFITHQYRLPSKSGVFAQLIHRFFLRKYTAVWVMDNASNLAGNLSQPCVDAELIGHFSRFEEHEHNISGGVVGIVSGPEPYSRQLFQLIVKYAVDNQQKVTIITPSKFDLTPEEELLIECITNDWRRADDAIIHADLILSRTGYSTLMDVTVLKKKALLIPTPGQLEQEYLAELHQNHPDWRISVSL